MIASGKQKEVNDMLPGQSATLRYEIQRCGLAHHGVWTCKTDNITLESL